MCGMMIDIGPKFYAVSSPTVFDPKVKVMDIEFLC